jgi:hypothetical protein
VSKADDAVSSVSTSLLSQTYSLVKSVASGEIPFDEGINEAGNILNSMSDFDKALVGIGGLAILGLILAGTYFLSKRIGSSGRSFFDEERYEEYRKVYVFSSLIFEIAKALIRANVKEDGKGGSKILRWVTRIDQVFDFIEKTTQMKEIAEMLGFKNVIKYK